MAQAMATILTVSATRVSLVTSCSKPHEHVDMICDELVDGSTMAMPLGPGQCFRAHPSQPSGFGVLVYEILLLFVCSVDDAEADHSNNYQLATKATDHEKKAYISSLCDRTYAKGYLEAGLQGTVNTSRP